MILSPVKVTLGVFMIILLKNIIILICLFVCLFVIINVSPNID